MYKIIKLTNFKIGESTLNGRIYDRGVFQKAIDEFNKQHKKVGYFNLNPNRIDEIQNLDNIAFLVSDLWIDADNTINSRIKGVRSYDSTVPYEYSFLGEGLVSKFGVVSSLKILCLTCSIKDNN